MSLGDERTFGDRLDDQVTVIGDIEVVDLASRYKTQGTLGRGGMGEVLLALDTRLDRKVAIKRILGEAARSKTAVSRFLTEAKAIAALNHPNVVQIYDYGWAKDGPFLIMEYVDGSSLLDRCRDGALPLDAAVDLACQLCDGLAKAHDLGIVHRDIKPANVLLTKDGLPKLTDFGLAKAEASDHGQTMTGAVLGTPDFMPPEQRRDAAEVDHRSDLWSLAATVYQMATGRSPKIIRFNDVPAALQDVLAKALEEDKDARYQSAREFRDALKTSVRAAAAVIDERGEGVCPSCGVKNDSRRRYCGGCGLSLEADCLSCTKPMPIWEDICGECGVKQTPLLQDKSAAMAARQAEAEGLLGDCDFERAIGIATQLRDEAHPKLKHLSGWASSFLDQIEKSRAEQTQQAVEAMAQAGKHEAAYDYLSAAAALESIPHTMRSALLPGMHEPAARMLERVIATQAEARRLETLIKDRVAAKQLDELLPEVEKLLGLRPDRVDVRKISGQLVERAHRQAIARNEAIATAKAALARHDYEAACAAFSGVVAAAVTPEVISLRERAEGLVRQVRSLKRTVKDSLAAKQFDGLLETVEQYLLIKPDDLEIGRLQRSLIEREEKLTAEIANRLEQAGRLEQACRFDEAAKLLEALPEPRRSGTVIATVERTYRLSVLRAAAMESLAQAGGGTYGAAIEASGDYRNAIAEARITDQEFSTLLARAESEHAEELRWRRMTSLAVKTAVAIAAGIAVMLGGIWIRSSARHASLASAIKRGRWDEALAIAPRNPEALIGLAKSKLASQPPDVDEAFIVLERAEQINRTNPELKAARAAAHATRAVDHAAHGRLSEAGADLKTAADMGADDVLVQASRSALASAWRAQSVKDAQADRLEDAGKSLTQARRYSNDDLQLKAAADALARAWVLRAEKTASTNDIAALKRACGAAEQAGAEKQQLAPMWLAVARRCVKSLDGDGLSLACTEAKRFGLPSREIAELWIKYGTGVIDAAKDSEPSQARAAELHAAASAANAALAEGASEQDVAALIARCNVLKAISAQSEGDTKAAVSCLVEAALRDTTLVRETINEPANASLQEAVLAEYRNRFDAAVSEKKWETVIQLGATAESLDPESSGWAGKAIAALPPSAFASLPPAALASLPPKVLASLSAATLTALPPIVLPSLPPVRNSIGIKLKLLPAGSFVMGHKGVPGRRPEETPHEVTLTKPFFIGVYEVTNAQWARVMEDGSDMRDFDDLPVAGVSWVSAVEFCRKLSEFPEERQAGRIYRLPTEAEWEYACRAGKPTEMAFGNGVQLEMVGWFRLNSEGKPHAVGTRMPNLWGLYDMHGNVWEWCSDRYDEYGESKRLDPQGPAEGGQRIIRGGSWGNDLYTASDRNWTEPMRGDKSTGFRIGLSLPGVKPEGRIQAESEAPNIAGNWSSNDSEFTIIQKGEVISWKSQDSQHTYASRCEWDGKDFVGTCERIIKGNGCRVQLGLVLTLKSPTEVFCEDTAMGTACGLTRNQQHTSTWRKLE